MHKKSMSKNRFPTINSILVQAYLYICIFLVVGRNIIFALRYHQPSPEISYHFCSEDFLGIPSAIKTNQIRLDPKQMIRIPTDWWNPMVRKWCFWGFVRGCVHGTHSWQLLSLGSMLKAVYFQLETWVSNPNRLLSTTGGWGNKQRVVIQYVPGILLLAFPWQNDMCRGYVNFEGCMSCHLQKRYTWITCDMHTKYQNSYPIHESSCHQQRQDFLCI